MKLEQKIGFDRIREMISGKCSTEYAKTRTSEERFSTSEEEIMLRQSLADEMKTILALESSFPDTPFIDSLPFILPLQAENSCIDLISLNKLRNSLDTLRKILHFFKNTKEENYPFLKKMTAPVCLFPEVNHRIDLILDRFGEVKDNASEELRQIRTSIREKEGTISKKTQAILRRAQEEGIVDEDASVSVRDGRVLIPISSGNKRKIAGIVYDESSSGKTSFVEPIEIVELNNQIRELYFAQKREIQRILFVFSEFLRPYLPEIIISAEYIGELDFIKAKASTAARFESGKPVVSKDGSLRIIRGRHPLLEEALRREGKTIVSLDLTLTAQKRILLISGPNAGGKSVCLKTVGLLQYMFQWGMPLSTSEISEFPIFDRIFIDIGDDQSIENDLSTYSSHLLNMKRVLEKATARSLVLIDEFGAGTEPAAGGAIAEQILSELEQRGCYGVITTHYTNLKFYAGNSNSVINGAMLFDVQKIQPLFKLEMGLPGNSFAFELARKIGLPETIVHGAEERAGSDFVTVERHLRKIARNKKQLEEKLARIKNTDKTLENIAGKYEKELTDIQGMRKKIMDEARKEAQELLSLTNKKIEATIKEIREAQADKEKTRELRKELETFTAELEEKKSSETDIDIAKRMEQIIARKKRQEERKAQRAKREASATPSGGSEKKEVEIMELKVGSKVRIIGNNLVGEVVQLSPKSISVAVGEIISKMSRDKVEVISAKQFKESVKPTPIKSSFDTASLSNRRLNFKPTIDIRGMRLEEAITTVTNFVDDALMVGMPQITILHGKGNGILREEIRKYLKITPGVTSFYDEHVERGGTGITIVEL